MNPRRKQCTCEVWEKQTITSPSGASKETWVDTGNTVIVSLYDQTTQNQITMGATGVRIKQYDVLGLTKLKTLQSDKNRLKYGDVVYRIKGVNNEGRLTQLFLEVVVNDG